MARVGKKKRVRWILDDKVVPANTPGARKEVRESEFYYAFWQEGGKLQQVHLRGVTSKRIAQERLAELLSNQGTVKKQDTDELATYLDGYLKEIRAGSTPEGHIRQNTVYLNRYIEAVGHRTLGTLCIEGDEGLAEAAGPNAGNKTQANVCSILNGFLKYVARVEKLPRLRVLYTKPEDATYRRRPHGTMTDEELRQLLASLPEPGSEQPLTVFTIARWRRRLIYLLMATTLTRLKTLVELTVEQFYEGSLHLQAGQVKSRRATSKPLIPWVAEELTRFLTRLAIGPDQRIFQCSASETRKGFHRDLKRAGLRTTDPAGRILAPHSLKGSGITLLIDQGLDITTISELAEHTSVNLTLSVYKDSMLRKRPHLAGHLEKLGDSLREKKEE